MHAVTNGDHDLWIIYMKNVSRRSDLMYRLLTEPAEQRFSVRLPPAFMPHTLPVRWMSEPSAGRDWGRRAHGTSSARNSASDMEEQWTICLRMSASAYITSRCRMQACAECSGNSAATCCWEANLSATEARRRFCDVTRGLWIRPYLDFRCQCAQSFFGHLVIIQVFYNKKSKWKLQGVIDVKYERTGANPSATR